MTTPQDYNDVSDEEMKKWVDEILITMDDDNGDFEEEIKKLKSNSDDDGISAPEIKLGL